jgi:hypothetical protein
MATSEALLFKINGAQQTAQLSGLSGKTYTVGKISAAGNTGLSKWLFLNPSTNFGGQSVALKIEGTQQLSQLSGLAGKTVTIGKAPATIGGTGKFLLLNTAGKGAATAAASGAGVAAAAKGGSASKMVLVKAEGARQMADASAFAGKSFTVMKPPMMGGMKTSNWMFLKPASGAGAAGEKIVALKVQGATGSKSAASMIGKTFTVSKAPMAAGTAAPQWLAFKPVAGVASKGAVATTVALKGNTAPAAALNGTGGGAGGAVAKNSVVQAAGNTGTTAGLAGKSTVAAQTAKTVGGGTIWKGTGLSLGLGLGLGAWGPLLLVGTAAFGVGVYGYMNNNVASEEEESSGELAELTLEG